MLQLRPNCECCNVDLPPESTEARICTFECTLLFELRRESPGRKVPELRRRVGAAAEEAGGKVGEVSGVDGASFQACWMLRAG